MASKAGSGKGPWQIKRVNSATGPVGSILSDAIRYNSSILGYYQRRLPSRQDVDVTGQTKVLWKATTGSNEVVNDYMEQNTTHDVLSNQNKEIKSSLGEYSALEIYYNRGEDIRKCVNYSSTILSSSRWLES